MAILTIAAAIVYIEYLVLGYGLLQELLKLSIYVVWWGTTIGAVFLYLRGLLKSS